MPGPMDNDGNKAYEKQIDEKHRSERLKQFEGHRVVEKSSSDFHHHGITALRAMVESADPDALERSGDHWRASADRLAGEDGRGGIRKAFVDAVEHASEHWRGSAADAFRREAAKVLEKVDRTYGHARNAEAMLIGTRGTGPQGGVAHSLREAKKAMSKIEDPGKVESAFNASGDDSQFHKDMANPKMDAKMALELNRDKLSLSKERQVEAVIVMEELASNYRSHYSQVDDGLRPPPGGGGDWPTPPTPHTPPPPVNMPTPGGPRPQPSALTPHTPAGPGVARDITGVNINPTAPPPRTDLDSVQGGTINPPFNGTIGGGTGTGGGGHVPGGAGGGGVPGGVVAPVPGMPGGGMRSGPGGRGGVPAGRGGVAGGRAGGTGAGRAGMPGGTGAGGGARGGAAGGAAAGRTGAQARTKGGVVGKPGSPTGGAKQGGSGLHRSRGGAQAGAGKKAGAAGLHGAPGARGNRAEDKERGTKQRPDYLVEDEETWTPQRNVAPRVIE